MSLGSYIKETKGEMRHVNWPTRRQTMALTAIVIAMSLVAGLYLGLFDFVFNLLLKEFVI